MTNIYTDIAQEINGIWTYLSIIDGKFNITDTNYEVLETFECPTEALWYFSTYQLDQFETTYNFKLPE